MDTKLILLWFWSILDVYTKKKSQSKERKKKYKKGCHTWIKHKCMLEQILAMLGMISFYLRACLRLDYMLVSTSVFYEVTFEVSTSC